MALFNDIWKMHHIPEGWETGLVINIHKKGSKKNVKTTEALLYCQQYQKYSQI
jgi:hypothetical protein